MDDDDTNASEKEEVYDEMYDPEWSDDAEDMVEDDSVETNSRRNVR